MKYDGSVKINTLLDTKGFKKDLGSMESSVNNSVNSMSKSFQKLGALVGKVLSVAAIVKFSKEAIELASDLSEVQNVVDTSFGSMSYKMEEFANSSVKNFGMSKLTAKQMGSTFMAMAKGMGGDLDSASDKAVELTGRLGDIASYYNKSMEEVSTIGRAIYSGETEPLKQIGVIMTQDQLKAFALAKGYKKTYDEMSAYEKLLVRQEYFLNATKDSAGDFVKTQDSWANQTKILKEQMKELMSVIGSGLITVLKPVVIGLNQLLGEVIAISQRIGQTLSSVFGIKTESISEAAASYDTLADSVDTYGDAVEAANKKAKKGLQGFNELNVISSNSSASSASGSGSGATTTPDIPVKEESAGAIDKVTEKFAPLIKAIDDFKASLEPLKSFTAKGLQDFYNDFLVPLGGWALGVGLPALIAGLTTLNTSIDWDTLNASFDDLWLSLEPFAENVGNGLLWFYNNVMIPLGTWVGNDAAPAFLNALSGALQFLNTAIEDLKPVFGWLWDNVLQPIASWTGGVIVTVLNGIGEALKAIAKNEKAMKVLETMFVVIGGLAVVITSPVTGIFLLIGAIKSLIKNWDALKEKTSAVWNAIKLGISVAIQNIKNSISSKITAIKNTWIGTWTVIKTFVGTAFNSIKQTVSSAITSVRTTITNIVGKIVSTWTNSWNTVKTTVTTIFTAIKTKISTVINEIKTTISTVVNSIKTVWDNVFGGLKDTVTSIFDGIWDKIKTICNSILGGIESMVNGVIKGFNSMINAMNKLSFTVPDWVPKIGGKEFGFDLSTINTVSLPRLATGGITTGSTLANIGEAGREAVLPLENNLNYLEPLANMIADKLRDSQIVKIIPDESAIFKVVQSKANDFYNRTGNPAFDY